MAGLYGVISQIFHMPKPLKRKVSVFQPFLMVAGELITIYVAAPDVELLGLVDRQVHDAAIFFECWEQDAQKKQEGYVIGWIGLEFTNCKALLTSTLSWPSS